MNPLIYFASSARANIFHCTSNIYPCLLATKLSKRAKKAARVAEEQRVQAKEEEALKNDAPQTAEAFDRQLLATPDNSLLWVKYIAFHLQVCVCVCVLCDNPILSHSFAHTCMHAFKRIFILSCR